MAKLPEDQKVTSLKLRWHPLAVVVGSIALFFVAQVTAAVLVSIYPLARGWTTRQAELWLNSSIYAQFGAALIFFGLLGYGVMALAKRLGFKKPDLGLVSFKAKDIVYALLGYGNYYIFLLVIVIAVENLIKSVDFNQKQQLPFSTDTAGLALVFIFVGLVILPAIVEELLCRGLMYSSLRTLYKPVVSAVIVSIIFAAGHLQWESAAPLLWVAALDTFILSLVLCYLREKTGSLWPCMILHGLKNSVAFFSLFLLPNLK